jgi:hypothetical protein
VRQTRQGISRITVDELGDNDAIVCTISSARIQSFSNDYLKGGDEKVVLTFDEFGAAEYVLNATSFRALADRYTNDKDNGFRLWLGKPCVLVRVATEDPRTGDKIESVWVARPSDWDAAMKALRAQETPPVAARKRTGSVARANGSSVAKKTVAKKRR